MRRNWTPSIVPGGHDQTVYLVADDFGRIGRAWIEADNEGTDLETVCRISCPGNTTIPFASSPSTPRSAGPRMFPEMSPQKYVAAAIFRRAMCHPLFRILLKVMKAAVSN